MEKHEGFSSKIGYVLAAAGSAVGLGNIWRFPNCAAKYGGGIFILTYIILVLTFGYSMLIAENCIGRMTRKGPIGTYGEFCNAKGGFWKLLRIGGFLNAVVPLVIVPYYCVIGGWVTKYVYAFFTTSVKNFDKDAVVDVGLEKVGFSTHYFTDFISSTWEPLLFFIFFAAIMMIVVLLGVEKGIERFNKVLMPALVVIIIAICVYCCFLPGTGKGYAYYFKPDFSKFSFMTVIAAMGQLFFSLSIAMGIMITYGSYMRKEDNLVSNVNQVQIFDTVVALLAGMMIIPSLVAFGGEEAAAAAGPGLVFITMPQVFASFPGGQIVGALFFLLVLFAAATSAISLLETNVQTISQELKISRRNSIFIGMAEIVVVGIFTVLGYSHLKKVRLLGFIEHCENMDILDSLDFVSNSVLMPICATLTVFLVLGCVGLNRLCKEVRGDFKWRLEKLFRFCICVIVIPCLLLVFLESIGIIK